MALSIVITGIVNLITFLLSIPLVGAGIWLATKLDTQCVRFLEWPIIAIGIIIFLVSLVGFIGACCRNPWLLYIYLVVMFFIILLLLIFIIFAFVVTKEGPAPERGRRSYNLQDYSPWLRKQLSSSSNWAKIKSCIMDANLCLKMNKDYKTAAAFYSADLSPIQSGCCMPPTVCGYTIAGPILWNNPSNLFADEDCGKWNNDQGVLCYSCNSCRAGVAANVKGEWHKVAVLSVVVLGVLIVVYIIGLFAFRNAQTADLFKRYEEHYHSRSWRRRNWFKSSAY